jgi:hypothetical protein
MVEMAVVPQTVRGADGLVEGDASEAKPSPRRVGHGGDVEARSPSVAFASGVLLCARGWKSSAENLSDILPRSVQKRTRHILPFPRAL